MKRKVRGIGVNGDWVYGDCGAHDVIFTFHAAECGINRGYWYTMDYIDPATLSESTGMTDMNGQEIFYGDIVTVVDVCSANRMRVVGVVRYDNGSFFVDCEELHMYGWEDYEVAVMGNIYNKTGGAVIEC